MADNDANSSDDSEMLKTSALEEWMLLENEDPLLEGRESGLEGLLTDTEKHLNIINISGNTY